jgi:prevent-host-death family protein
MKRVNVADPKARLSELVTRAAAGEPVCIMRRGRPVVSLPSALPAWLAILASFVVLGSGSRKGLLTQRASAKRIAASSAPAVAWRKVLRSRAPDPPRLAAAMANR